MKAKHKLFVAILLVSFSQCYCQSQNTEKSVEWVNFDVMATYLSQGTGKWTGENKNYDSTRPRSPKAFGLWFTRPLKSMMTIKIVAYVQDTVLLSSQGIFAWHPEKKQFIHVTSDLRSGFSEGYSSFPNDTTFISTMVNYRPNGKVSNHKDENFIVNENVHRNTSYGKNEKGEWTEKGNWVWTRDPE
ncbi:MAG: hypothetical protein ABJP45_02155 [Cyclobacteriaceae bacterium]